MISNHIFTMIKEVVFGVVTQIAISIVGDLKNIFQEEGDEN